MKRKINQSLVGIAIAAISITLLGVVSIYYHLFVSQVEKDLRILAETIVDAGVLDKEMPERINLDSQNVRMTWIDMDGVVLYDNWAEASSMENHLLRPEVQQALLEGEGESVRNSDTLQMNTYYFAFRIDDGTVFRVATKANSGVSIFLSAVPIVVPIVGVIVLVCVFFADYLTKRLMKPIVTLGENLEAVSGFAVQEKSYKELIPFLDTIRTQHENILAAAKMRQDFTANVSHELKTPLTAISGYAELIENKMVSPEQEIAFAGEIRKNSDRLLTLINDIIRLSELDGRKEYDGFTTVDLYEIALECSQNLSVNAQRREIDFVLQGESCTLHGNHQMLVELINNLCENAIRYNREGGSVCLEITERDGHACMVVSDNGIGIPKEHQERVFERFYRVDKSHSKETGGTGLGLAIVKHIVAIHGAKITLDSEVGNGTKITVLF